MHLNLYKDRIRSMRPEDVAAFLASVKRANEDKSRQSYLVE